MVLLPGLELHLDLDLDLDLVCKTLRLGTISVFGFGFGKSIVTPPEIIAPPPEMMQGPLTREVSDAGVGFGMWEGFPYLK